MPLPVWLLALILVDLSQFDNSAAERITTRTAAIDSAVIETEDVDGPLKSMHAMTAMHASGGLQLTQKIPHETRIYRLDGKHDMQKHILALWL